MCPLTLILGFAASCSFPLNRQNFPSSQFFQSFYVGFVRKLHHFWFLSSIQVWSLNFFVVCGEEFKISNWPNWWTNPPKIFAQIRRNIKRMRKLKIILQCSRTFFLYIFRHHPEKKRHGIMNGNFDVSQSHFVSFLSSVYEKTLIFVI